MDKKNGYNLAKQWWEFAEKNPDRVKPKHTALYLYLVELNNKLKWVDTFGVPTYNTMKMLGISSYNTYKEAFNDLEEWGLIKVLERAKNNHTSRVVELSKFDTSNNTEDETEVSKNDTSNGSEVSKNDISGGFEVSKNDTILKHKTKHKTKQGEPDKQPPSRKDFIDMILETFTSVFTDYVITSKEKQRKGGGVLINVFKELYPDNDTDQQLSAMRDFFVRCKNLNDKWHRPKMSVHHIAIYYNELNELMKQPKGRNRHEYSGAGTDWDEEQKIK